ncbi:MAG: hypothetical protein J6V15_04590 [Clostridia bacterium]|nr:hypothetical protein [Clostridia bacterium]
MSANFTLKLGMTYLYGSLLTPVATHIEFDKPVKKLRAPVGVGLSYDNEGTDTIFDYVEAGKEIEFPNIGGYPQAFDIIPPDSFADDLLPLSVSDYGDVANADYFKPVEPEGSRTAKKIKKGKK